MPQDVYAIYNSLSTAQKQEVHDFMMFIAKKTYNPIDTKKNSLKKNWRGKRHSLFPTTLTRIMKKLPLYLEYKMKGSVCIVKTMHQNTTTHLTKSCFAKQK